MKKIVCICSLTFMVIIFSHSVLAGEKENEGKPWERFSLSLGGFITTINSDVSLGLPGVGIEIDVEEALGLDSRKSVFKVDGLWRFTRNRRHRLDFSWFDISRDASKKLLRDIEIGDTGLERFNFLVQADRKDYPGIDFRGNIEFNYFGLMAYCKIHF